jgi:signal transduction histidine kinase
VRSTGLARFRLWQTLRSGGIDEDARLLRRTRLRLMAVSGLVTLVILVALGTAVYLLVSTTVETGAENQLMRATLDLTRQPRTPSSSYGVSVEGPAAGLVPVLVDADGTAYVPEGLKRIPPGLPDSGGLAAVKGSGDVDVRNVTLADGTPCRIMTTGLPGGLKLQMAQNRTGEVSLLNTLAQVLLGGGLLALLASLLAGYLYAGRALVPIRASIDRRQAALQRQREFAANASHELRTPLTVVAASVEDLKRNRRSKVADVGEAVSDIEAEVRHMAALVEDMLLLARTDSGVIQIERISLDLADVAVDAAPMLTTLGQERGVSVVLDPLPALTDGDPLRLRQLVTILVDNAIRHSPAGSTVTATVRPEAGAAQLRVDDQGPGIKPEDLPRIFERFWRADNAPVGGTGLGLAIARWIVEQHGGTIGAVNLPEGGASFRVWLPAQPSVKPPADTPVEPPAASPSR